MCFDSKMKIDMVEEMDFCIRVSPYFVIARPKSFSTWGV